MSQIKIGSNMIFDAICTIEYLNGDKFNSMPEQIAFSQKIDKLTYEKLKKGSLGKTNTCIIIASYYNDKMEIENLTFDYLIDFFQNPQNIYGSIIKQYIEFYGERYKEFIKENQLDQMWKNDYLPIIKNYADYINILMKIDFEMLWQLELLPIIEEEINKKEVLYNKLDIDSTLADIQKLKQCEQLGDVKIHVNVMSFPTSFKLPGNSFLSCIDNEAHMGAGLICHELMHGFTTKELDNLYLEYIKSNEYLMEQYDILINKQQAIIEEEFVDAAEYYLRMKHNKENKNDLLIEAKKRYNGCLPTSVFLFDLLSKEPETPNGYVNWLIGIFKNKKLPQKDIKYHFDNIITV